MRPVGFSGEGDTEKRWKRMSLANELFLGDGVRYVYFQPLLGDDWTL